MSTLIKPPPNNPNLSAMENTLELRQLRDINPDMFTNARPLWHPPGARGVYGGAVIAQCLAAAQRTVPSDFLVHSMHCYFVLAGNSEIPIIYHVEHVREGKSFATRTVQAQQRAQVIFTVTLSFQREGSAGKKKVQHQQPLPDVPGPIEDETEVLMSSHGPFESQHFDSVYDLGKEAPYSKRARMWLKARGRISDEGGHQAHLNALAYMSDSFFIGTVARAHNLWRRPPPNNRAPDTRKSSDAGEDDDDERLEGMKQRIRAMNGNKDENDDNRPEIGMMVSLDHTIYFHSPKDFRADEWLFSEMQTPWSGDGRGVVQQSVWTRDGRLVATCFQEGLVRLRQNNNSRL